MLDERGEPIVKLYMPHGCDITDFWIKDTYGHIHQIDNGDTWVPYGEYEDGIIYVPEEDAPESKRLPRIIS